MKTGDVFYWETTKARGHEKRFKYQIFICNADWEEGYTFLFISSEGIEGDYKIENPPYSFLTKRESFVSCNSIVTYTDEELYKIGDKVGTLSKKHLMEIHQAVANSFIMERRHILRVCNALRAYCR
jgi:hypothetical protein